MMYLIAQTWLFLGIAWLIGIAAGFALARDQKSQRHRDTQEQLRDARHRAIDVEKDLENFRARVAELEGLPQGVRASRVAAREELVAQIAALERELNAARVGEKRLNEEAERLRGDVDGFRTRYLEARAKWDEYQAKAEALAEAPAPLTLGEAHVIHDDDGMRQRVIELEGLLAEATRLRERAGDQAKTLSARVGDLEAQLAKAAKGNGRGDAEAAQLKTRIGELEARIAEAGKGGEPASEQAKILQARITELETRLAAGINAARENDALRSRVGDLQDKLGEAEIALSKAVGEPSGMKTVAENTALRSRLAESEAKLAEAQRRLTEFESKGTGLLATNNEELRRLQTRTVELEKALERARAQAGEAQNLRAQVARLEDRLAAAADAEADRSATGEDVSLLKARLADVEARLMASSGASMEFDSLRNRVMTLESLLHEAAKSRDEAAILRSKVAELDGRLGQAMKAVAETRTRAAESEKV